ncbi:chymotrypsinogen 2-like [Clytia hemisphaerica]|uniref:chymotrypsinogen 2-like n=1 Tax=Clytia hemisphaerica TaxID=252671 RepID=UPI0034D77935
MRTIYVFVTLLFVEATGRSISSDDDNLKAPPAICGLRGNGQSKIVGGSESKPGYWPWQVQVDNTGRDNKRYWCGGTLLNEDWIMSAAHCFERDPTPKNYSVYLGEHDIDVDESHQQKYEIAEIHMHPEYNSSSYNSDLALLRLKRKARFSKYARPACLPDDTVQFYSGEECYVTGWGDTTQGGNQSHILLQAKTPLVPQSVCQMSLQNYTITSRMVCAGYRMGGVDSCQGDSGGPLVCRKRNKILGMDQWYLWGVVSWGIGCARPEMYGVYAKVNTMSDWIKTVTNL